MNFENKKAILYDRLVVKNEDGDYGVINSKNEDVVIKRLGKANIREQIKMLKKAAKEKKAANEVIQQQQEQAATQQALDVMENRATSKYYPIIFAGVFGLLALSILRN